MNMTIANLAGWSILGVSFIGAYAALAGAIGWRQAIAWGIAFLVPMTYAIHLIMQ